MKPIVRVRAVTLALLAVAALWCVDPSLAQSPAAPQPKYPAYPSESPATVKLATESFDYVRRDVMIPMRDGVKLHTVILVPKGAKRAPILLTRTPYDATALTTHIESPHLGPIALRLRQRDRRDRRGRIHPGRPGHSRQVRLRGRLRDEPPDPRAPESDARRSRDRHLRHDRLAREERPGEQRQGRHPRHLVRRLPAADGADQSAPGAEGRRCR